MPLVVIFDLLGVPKEYYDTLRASASAFARFPPAIYSRDYSLLASIANNLEATEQLLLGLLAERRRTPQNDLISSLASTVEGSASLTDGEIVVLCNFLLFAGHETTANLIGGSVLHLLQNREQWESLRENAESPGWVVEELLRHVSPVLTISRVLKEDVERHGVTMKKGDRVLLGVGAANHDPAKFPDMIRFNSIEPILILWRSAKRAHHCIGASLARMEAQIALQALFRELPEMRLTSDKVEYHPIFYLTRPEVFTRFGALNKHEPGHDQIAGKMLFKKWTRPGCFVLLCARNWVARKTSLQRK